MAKYEFTNWEQLESVVNMGVREALNQASEVAIDKLISLIDENVYSVDEGWYQRTGDLKDRENWEAVIHKGIKGYTLEINLVPNHFTHNTALMQHTNAIGNDIEIESLVGILNGDVSLSPKSNLSAWGIEHEPFWDEFMEWFRSNFTQVFYEKLNMIRS